LKHLALIIILSTYVLVTVWEVEPASDMKYPDYVDHIIPFLDNCKLDEYPTRWDKSENDMGHTRSPLKWHSICLSDKAFGNENVIPFLFSIGCLGLTYYLGYKIGGHEMVGSVAMLVMMFTNAFTRWDTSATYDQSWSFFLLCSVSLLYVKPKWSWVSYICSVLSKALSILYIPMYLYHAKQVGQLKWALVSVVVIICIAVILISTLGFMKGLAGGDIELNLDDFITGLWVWIPLFADDPIIMFVPVVLAWLAIQRIRNWSIPFVWVVGIILSVPIILGFTDQLVHPYRFVPMVSFVGIAVGMMVYYYYPKVKSLISNRLVKKP